MPFVFGANWSEFSRICGEVFGSFLAIEGMTAFTIESIFLGIVLFARTRVSKRAYYISTLVVFFGAHLSAFWIVAANSWLQTPAGYVIRDGRFVAASLAQAIFNPTTLIRFLHVVTGAWITGVVVCSAIAAFFVLRNRSNRVAVRMVWVSIVLLALLPLAELEIGHEHILSVSLHQPAKGAAFEGMFKTMTAAPEYLMGVPDVKTRTIRFGLGIPGLLSFLNSGRWNSEVKGLDQFPDDYWPPVGVVFTTFHLMVIFGVTLIGLGFVGAMLLVTNRLESARWYLVALILCVPLPYASNELGWMGTEIGRQPWLVYGVLKTANAVSPSVSRGQILFSLVMLSVVYAALFGVFAVSVGRIIRKGLEPV
jgi:cytochrome d ubiquinol oxidase subunit I